MTLTQRPDARRRFAAGPSAWLLAVAGVLVVAVMAAIAIDRPRETPSASSTRGSGVSVTDHREAGPFAGVELAGANTVVINVGQPLSVAVTGDDNLVARVTTVVRDGNLVVDDAGSFTTKTPMHVEVSVPSLASVQLDGAGTITIDGVASADFTVELAGDGTVVVSGTAGHATAVLAGAGTLDLHDLVARDATAQLLGTGTIRIHATSTLDATLKGTGTILYGGDPTVTMRSTGTGSVGPE